MWLDRYRCARRVRTPRHGVPLGFACTLFGAPIDCLRRAPLVAHSIGRLYSGRTRRGRHAPTPIVEACRRRRETPRDKAKDKGAFDAAVKVRPLLFDWRWRHCPREPPTGAWRCRPRGPTSLSSRRRSRRRRRRLPTARRARRRAQRRYGSGGTYVRAACRSSSTTLRRQVRPAAAQQRAARAVVRPPTTAGRRPRLPRASRHPLWAPLQGWSRAAT